VRVIDHTAQLALTLGADPTVVTGARAEYDAAADRLRTAATSGLQVLVVAAYPAEGFYVAKAPDDPTLTAFASMDHAAQAAYMAEMAGHLESARKVV
jgi:iron complex transport system substrate-binding protein